jgi:hypothetical protein
MVLKFASRVRLPAMMYQVPSGSGFAHLPVPRIGVPSAAKNVGPGIAKRRVSPVSVRSHVTKS